MRRPALPGTDNVKMFGEEMHTEHGISLKDNEAPGQVIPAVDQEAIALLAYYYWEARGCPYDSPLEASLPLQLSKGASRHNNYD